MIILNELNRPYIIDSLTQPLVLRHHWVFNAQMLDFTMSEITYLEETQGPTITLQIADSEVRVPGAWNILVVDKETYTVDAVPVSACAAFEHEAFVFSPEDGKPAFAAIRAIGWDPAGSCIYPAVDRAKALVHSISPGSLHGKSVARGVVIGPNDLWRYIGGRTIGDILN